MDEPIEQMRRYTYYARSGVAITPLFSLFAPREPTAEEVRAFRQQVMTQTRDVSMPRPSYVSVEELQVFDAGAIQSSAPVNGDGGA